MPSPAIFSGRMPTSSVPSRLTLPLVSTIWHIARIVVVLPAPLAPRSTTTSPSSTCRSSPRRTCTGPYAASSPDTSSIVVIASTSHRAPEVGLDHARIVLDVDRGAVGDLAPEVEDDHLVGDSHHQL